MRTHTTIQASNVEPVEDLVNERGAQGDELVEPSRKRRRTRLLVVDQEDQPQFRVYCPCLKCESRSQPTLRLLRICTDHIAHHGLGTKWKVIFLLIHNLETKFHSSILQLSM